MFLAVLFYISLYRFKGKIDISALFSQYGQVEMNISDIWNSAARV